MGFVVEKFIRMPWQYLLVASFREDLINPSCKLKYGLNAERNVSQIVAVVGTIKYDLGYFRNLIMQKTPTGIKGFSAVIPTIHTRWKGVPDFIATVSTWTKLIFASCRYY